MATETRMAPRVPFDREMSTALARGWDDRLIDISARYPGDRETPAFPFQSVRASVLGRFCIILIASDTPLLFLSQPHFAEISSWRFIEIGEGYSLVPSITRVDHHLLIPHCVDGEHVIFLTPNRRVLVISADARSVYTVEQGGSLRNPSDTFLFVVRDKGAYGALGLGNRAGVLQSASDCMWVASLETGFVKAAAEAEELARQRLRMHSERERQEREAQEAARQLAQAEGAANAQRLAEAAREVPPDDVLASGDRILAAWNTIAARACVVAQLDQCRQAAAESDQLASALQPILQLKERLKASRATFQSWSDAAHKARAMAAGLASQSTAQASVASSVQRRNVACIEALAATTAALGALEGAIELASATTNAAALADLPYYAMLQLTGLGNVADARGQAAGGDKAASLQASSVERITSWLAQPAVKKAAATLADFTPDTSFAAVAGALEVLGGPSNEIPVLPLIRSTALCALSVLAEVREMKPERLALMRQERTVLQGELAQLQAESTAAAVLADVQKLYPSLLTSAKEARSKLRRARLELEEAEEEGCASQEMYSRLSQLQERAAEAQRTVEAAAEAVRRYAAAGLAEAIAMEPSLLPAGAAGAGAAASTPKAAGGGAGAPPSSPSAPGATVGSGTALTEFQRMWRTLQQMGIAYDDRSRADYEGLQPLASGRFPVYVGRLRGTQRMHVLKEFGRAIDAHSAVLLNEIRLLRQLAHPNVIALEAVFQDGPHVYLQLPYVEGGPLDKWLVAAPRSLEDRLRVFRGVVSAVAYLHSQRIVHRDLKPSNVLLRADGSPVVADFGISLALGSALHTALPSTFLGRGAGTQDYKSPEQLREEAPAPPSDVYALGLILHDLIFGTPYSLPLPQRVDVNGAVVLPDAAPPAIIPPQQSHALDAAKSLLRRLLAPSAEDRPLTAAVLADPLCDPGLLTVLLPLPAAVSDPAAAGKGGGKKAGRAAAAAPAAAAAAGAASAASPPTTALEGRIAAVRRGLAAALSSAQVARVRLRTAAESAAASGGEAVLRDLTPAILSWCDGTGSSTSGSSSPSFGGPWRLVVNAQATAGAGTGAGASGNGGGVDTERVLDAFAALCMRTRPATSEGGGGSASSGDDGDLPIFVTSAQADDFTAPIVLPSPDADSRRLRAFGAVLAQAALQGASLDVVPRLHPLTFAVLAKGPAAVAQGLAASVTSALAALEPWDGQQAKSLRSVLLSDGAGDLEVDLPGWRGTDEKLTDANKEDAVRRLCVQTLVSSRLASWDSLRSGFLSAGGAAVLEALDKEAAAHAAPVPLSHLMYEPGLNERRARNNADNSASETEVRRLTKPCPQCGVPVFKDGGCDHMYCTLCGTHYSWHGRPVW